MSLSTLNYPPLVALSGFGLGAYFPVLGELAKNSPWATIRLACAISYGINVIAVSRPGRMDGEVDENGELAPTGNKTLVAPSGWAFAIWGPIFIGELVSVTSTFFIKDSNAIVSLLRQTSAPFVAAQLFQSLWCAAFRPKYKGASMFINTGLLSATAYSLSRAHAAFVAQPQLYSNLQYGIFLLPISLHFGWTVAASIVSVNGAVAMQENASKELIAVVGHSSVIAGTALGVYVTIARSAPVFGGVIAWALTAVAAGMRKRLDDANGVKKKDKEIVGIYGASTQYMLSRAGAAINALTVAFVAGTMGLALANKKSPVP